MQYFVTGNLNHDGEEYKRGDTIELGEGSIAGDLLLSGVIQNGPIEEPAEPAPEPSEAEAPGQPEVGGKPMETGEPSIDGQQQEQQGPDTAEDVTPGAEGMRALSPDVRVDAPNAPQAGSEAVVEPSEAMTRAELETMAREANIDPTEIEKAPNKAALVELIRVSRDGKPTEPENDPSADL